MVKKTTKKGTMKKRLRVKKKITRKGKWNRRRHNSD